jgi:hypothetical protein
MVALLLSLLILADGLLTFRTNATFDGFREQVLLILAGAVGGASVA